jgi:two-component system response regulator YesN
MLYQKQKRIQLTLKYSDDFDFEPKSLNLKSQIHAFISEHYSNSELKAIDLANHLTVPEYKIGEILKENVGMTFKSFLNHTRIEAAKLYLKNSSYSISEIAYKTGFNSPSSFNRVFKEMTKQSPGEFKN